MRSDYLGGLESADGSTNMRSKVFSDQQQLQQLNFNLTPSISDGNDALASN